MNIVLLGSPGSGKTAVGESLQNKYGLLHISTGDLLRKNGIDLSSGNLVSDETVFKVLKEHIDQTKNSAGYVLDGIPRTAEQAEKLDRLLKIDCVISLEISEKAVYDRLLKRMVCPKCGNVQSYIADAKVQKCKVCGAELEKRSDDEFSTIKHRLEVFKNHSEQLKQYYYSKNILHIVNAEDTRERVFQNVESVIKKAQR